MTMVARPTAESSLIMAAPPGTFDAA